MKKQSKIPIRYIIIIIILFILIAGAGITGYRKILEKRTAGELSSVLHQITYDIENNQEEVDLLLDFKEQASHLSHRNAAVYYNALTKLYMLHADWDRSLNYFVDAQLNAEIAGANDVTAWLYANIAQTYIGYSNYEIAIRCLDISLEYGSQQQMQPFFYEYCYTMLGELYSYLGDFTKATQYCEKALGQDSEDFLEYQSMELRRTLVQARAAYEKDQFEQCHQLLDSVGQYIDGLDYMPMDALWGSGIYYPWMEQKAVLAMQEGSYDEAISYLDEMMSAGFLYSQTDRLMESLSKTISFLDEMTSQAVAPEQTALIEDYVKELLKEYPHLFAEKNKDAGEHIYNANMVTAAVFIQNYKLQTVYFKATVGIIFVALIITVLVLVWQQSVKKGRIDGLTGAYNRKYFNEYLDSLKKSHQPYGMIMYDIDFFKQVNDGFGHEAGDEVLKISAHLAMSLLDRNSKLFRFGGDEFCILCRHDDLEQIAEQAEKIRIGVQDVPWQWTGLKATLSMGAAVYTDAEPDVMAAADAMLYQSKERGRNCVSFK